MFRNNSYLRGPNEAVTCTPNELFNLARCSKNIERFLDAVQSADSTFEVRAHQQQVLRLMQDTSKLVVASLARQFGKTTLAAVYALWYAMYNADKCVIVTSTKHNTAVDLMTRIRGMYVDLPMYLKVGIRDCTSSWSKDCVRFSNGSMIQACAPASSAIRGKHVDLLVIDDCAHIDAQQTDIIDKTIIPTLMASASSKIVALSTPKGDNFFKQLFDTANSTVNCATITKTIKDMRYDADLDELTKEFGKTFVEQEYMCKFVCSNKTDTLATVVESDLPDALSTSLLANRISKQKTDKLVNTVIEELSKDDISKYKLFGEWVPTGRLPPNKRDAWIKECMTRAMPTYMKHAVERLKQEGFELNFAIKFDMQFNNPEAYDELKPVYVNAFISV